MNNVKAIFDNTANKAVKKIADENGNVIWRKNLFLGFDSPWCCNFSIAIADGKMASLEGNRTTYFFKVKPNTTYRYTATTPGDRFNVYAIKADHNEPPTFSPSIYPYNETADNIGIIDGTVANKQNPITDYTFTTGPNDMMVYIYSALNTRPTGVRIEEV